MDLHLGRGMGDLHDHGGMTTRIESGFGQQQAQFVHTETAVEVHYTGEGSEVQFQFFFYFGKIGHIVEDVLIVDVKVGSHGTALLIGLLPREIDGTLVKVILIKVTLRLHRLRDQIFFCRTFFIYFEFFKKFIQTG